MTVRHNNARPPNSRLQLGATLVELILTIVIISVALTGILTIVNLTVSHSADPMLQRQAIAIAESYLEEIMLLPINDPDGSNAGETRSSYDNLTDYDGLSDNGATDQNNTPLTGLENYTVDVTVTDDTLSGVTMKKVTVSVTRTGTDSISLSGYRANY